MTQKEFEQTYCMMCGSQRCGGASDKEFREGCIHYQNWTAIAYYNRGINEDIFSPEVAAYARLAVEALKRWERTDEQTYDCCKD